MSAPVARRIAARRSASAPCVDAGTGACAATAVAGGGSGSAGAGVGGVARAGGDSAGTATDSAATGVAGGVAGGVAALTALAACSTSPRVIAPRGPVPRTASRSTPSLAASRRASGEASTRTGCAAARSPDGASTGLGLAAIAVSPAATSTASAVPTGTVSPSWTSRRSTTPVSNTSTSLVALSVSTSAMMSPLVTWSPSVTRQRESVPRSMSAPSTGMRNSPIAGDALPDGGHDGLDLGQRGVLEVLRVRDGDLGGADAQHGRVEPVEGPFDDPCRHLGRDTAASPALVHDDCASRPAHRRDDCISIEGAEGAQVDYLAVDVLLRKAFCRLQCLWQRAAVGDQREIVPMPPHRRVRDLHRTGVLREITLHVVEDAILEDEHRIGVLEGRPEHPSCVLERGGCEHFQPRNMRVPPFEAVSVL